jgi:hypothetical protein
MKSVGLLSIALLGCCAVAAAQESSPAALPPVQAPPTISEPGVTAPTTPPPDNQPAAAPAAAAGDAATAPAPAPAPKPESPGLPDDVQAAAEAAELPVITVRQQGSETVEEYRKRGKLYFVRVISNEGPTRFYVDNPASIPPSIMQQLSGPSGQVQPVYFKLGEWK